MLIRSTQVDPEKDFNDSMNTTPTLGRSVYDNFAAGAATPSVGVALTQGEFGKTPEGKSALNSLNAINYESEAPGIGWGQWLADEGANMLGFGSNPLSWVLGEAGGAAAGVATKVAGAGLSKVLPDAATAFVRKPLSEVLGQRISKYIPSMVGKEGGEQALSAGILTDKTLSTFGTFAGVGVPQGIVDNYNQDTNHIAWGGVARDAGNMGAFGLAIGTIPYAWGVLRGKINRGLGKAPTDAVDAQTVTDAATKNILTPDEHQWYQDYLAHDPKDEAATQSLQERATQIVTKNGHTANTVTNEAPFHILTPDEVTNLHGVIADQLANNDLPDDQRNALSDYLIHNSLDHNRTSPQKLDGVRGYVDFINNKLAAKPEKLAEADAILDDHLEKRVNDSMPLSQKELASGVKRAGIEPSQAKNLPLTIPDEVAQHLKHQADIKRLESVNKKLFKKYEQTGDQKHIESMKANESKIQHMKRRPDILLKPKEELRKIKQELLGKSETYYRGVMKEPFGFRTLEEAGTSEEAMRKNDLWLGKGYWYAENKYHAEKYGDAIQKIKGKYKIFDPDTSKDEELKIMYRRLKNTERLELLPDVTGVNKLVDEFRNAVKAKGYQGIRRFGVVAKDTAEYEVMFFEKPKDQISKGLPKGWQNSKAYHRLLDLSSVWHNANTLLDRVHLEHEYERQEAFKDTAESFLKVADSDQPALARPNNVVNYLKDRIEGRLKTPEPIADLEAQVEEKAHVPPDADTDAILAEQAEQTKNTAAKDAKEALDQSTEKMQEFKDNPGIFKFLISCVMGAVANG